MVRVNLRVLFSFFIVIVFAGCRDIYPAAPPPSFDLDVSKSIEGLDIDGNGIRDDIEVYLSTLTITEKQMQYALEVAEAIQSKLVTTTSHVNKLEEINELYVQSVFCFTQSMQDLDQTGNVVDNIHSYTVNTPERIEKFNAAKRATELLKTPDLSFVKC